MTIEKHYMTTDDELNTTLPCSMHLHIGWVPYGPSKVFLDWVSYGPHMGRERESTGIFIFFKFLSVNKQQLNSQMVRNVERWIGLYT